MSVANRRAERLLAKTPAPRVGAVRITLRGHVQGVGFRPFVYRLAHEHGITGYVQNQLGEVEVVACGDEQQLENFKRELIERAPPLACPELVSSSRLDTQSFSDFEITPSLETSDASIFIPPDYFMCDDCRDDLGDPDDRRYRYPFTNCTQCGPRYTLIEALPYDRPNTSMASFPLCADCEREYRDPRDRRFHAEPVACPACGPQLSFEGPGYAQSLREEAALAAAVDAIRDGNVLAVKGIGGYHLVCDATNESAVAELRRRKHRPRKPLAVMFPADDDDALKSVREYATLDDASATLITSPARPIVLVRKNARSRLAPGIAPGLGEVGVFLPYSPLHQLLLDAAGGPLVATSGNISGEPVLTDNAEAETRLADIADAFLHHDRPIVRPADDSVYRTIGGRPRPIRLGRGAAPLEMRMPWQQSVPTLAVGGHMKATLALSWGDRVVVSPHIGEMDAPRSLAVFEKVAADLQNLYGISVERIVCDAHTGYTTHRWARKQGLPVETVWHHRAHASALAGEQERSGQWLVFAWDGVGLGEDGKLWGGEALLGAPGDWRRVASLRPFRLPGGERAGREPWRSAAALNWECGTDWQPARDPDGLARTAWDRDLNCPTSSAAGRVFDAAAAMVLGCDDVSFEAEGPMWLESLCRAERPPVATDIVTGDDGVLRSDWQPLLPMLADDSLSTDHRAETFHSSMAQIVVDQAVTLRAAHDIEQVGLTGGVFQNRVLTDTCVERLTASGFDVYLAADLPCNDGGLCFGQSVELAAREQRSSRDG